MLDLIAAIVSGISFIVLNVSGQSFPPPLGAEEERDLFRRLRAGMIERYNDIAQPAGALLWIV